MQHKQKIIHLFASLIHSVLVPSILGQCGPEVLTNFKQNKTALLKLIPLARYHMQLYNGYKPIFVTIKHLLVQCISKYQYWY